jgi:hypothetical protein
LLEAPFLHKLQIAVEISARPQSEFLFSQSVMYLHVRLTFAALKKESTLMLHSGDKEGSLWRVQHVPNTDGTVFTLLAHRSNLYLHVRKSWKLQREEDTLMLCHHGAGDSGSEWRCLPGFVPGTTYLVNRRSEQFLRLRPSWASEDKGSHFALSPIPDHLCAWCFDPVMIPAIGGMPSWQLLRSPSAIERSTPTNATGPSEKFSWSGAWQCFPGFSVVADVPSAARNEFSHGRTLVAESAKGRSLFSATLPLSSLHMTVCGFDALGANVQHVQGALASFADEVKATGERFRGIDVTVRWRGSGRAIRLDVASVEPRGPFAVLRRKLREICGQDGDEPADNKLHINLGWYQLWLAPQEQQDVADQSLEPALAELNGALRRIAVAENLAEGELPLELPHLSHYPDMSSFPHNCETSL